MGERERERERLIGALEAAKRSAGLGLDPPNGSVYRVLPESVIDALLSTLTPPPSPEDTQKPGLVAARRLVRSCRHEDWFGSMDVINFLDRELDRRIAASTPPSPEGSGTEAREPSKEIGRRRSMVVDLRNMATWHYADDPIMGPLLNAAADMLTTDVRALTTQPEAGERT